MIGSETMLPDDVEIDRRRSPRHRVFKGGSIHFNGGFGALECLVRNVSNGGSRLQFEDATLVPSHFVLTVGDDHSGKAVTARWRKGRVVGVSFD